MAQSVYDRCGGFQTVRRVVSDFYDKVLDSESLEQFFAGVEMARLIDHQTKFIAQVMGGPISITDEQLRRAHMGLGITHEDFKEVAALLQEALEDNGFSDSDVMVVVEAIVKREPMIVSPMGA